MFTVQSYLQCLLSVHNTIYRVRRDKKITTEEQQRTTETRSLGSSTSCGMRVVVERENTDGDAW